MTKKKSNQATALMEKLSPTPNMGDEIASVQEECVMLHTNVVQTHQLLTHPKVMAAKEFHPDLIKLAKVLTADLKAFGEELNKYGSELATRDLSQMSDEDKFAFYIYMGQEYQGWIDRFVQNVIPIASDISEIIVRIDAAYPDEPAIQPTTDIVVCSEKTKEELANVE